MRTPEVLEHPRVRALIPVVGIVLLGAGALWELLSLSGIPVARDMQMFFIPQKHILWEALQAGEVPLWTRFIGTGSPFLANVQSGVFYPPNWLYAVLPFYAAFNLLVVLHFVLGGLFAYVLCRRLGIGREGAFVGALCWMMGGYFSSLLNLINALQGAVWAPALAWALVRMLDDHSHRGVAILALVAASAVLAGEPQSFLFAGLASTVVFALAFVRRGEPVGRLARPGSAVVVAAAVVIGLTMIQVLPTLELLDVAGRTGGLSFGEAAAFDLQPIRMVHFLVPPDYSDPEYAFGVRSVIGRGDPWLFSVYLGALWPILGYFAWRRRGRRREVAIWTSIAALSVVVALGENTPVYPWLFEHVPGFGAFRFPEKYLFGVAFGAMLIGGWGADELFHGEPRRGDRVFVGAYAAVVAVATVWFRLSRDWLEAFAARYGNDRMMSDFDFAYGAWVGNVTKWLAFVAAAGVLLWLYRRRTLTRPVFVPLVTLLVAADLAVAHRGLNPVVERSFYETEPLLFETVPIDDVRTDYRLRTSRFDSIAGSVPVIRGIPLEAQKWLWQQIVAPNVGQKWGVLQQDAWDAIKLPGFRTEQQLQRAIPDIGRRWSLLRLHSVKYVHSILDVDPRGYAREIPLDTLSGHLYEIEAPLPRAYVASRAERFPDDVSLVNRVLSDEFDPHRTVALIDSTLAGASASPGVSQEDEGRLPEARLTHVTDREVRVTVTGIDTDGSYLVLTDSDYPGWTATVDGVVRPIETANLFFRAVALDPGDSEVTFSYESRPFERGRLIALLTLAIALGLFVLLETRQRRRSGGG